MVDDGVFVGEYVGACVVAVGEVEGPEVDTVGDEVALVGDEDGDRVGVELGDLEVDDGECVGENVEVEPVNDTHIFIVNGTF